MKLGIVSLLLVAATATAQSGPPPIRLLGPIVARAPDSLAIVIGVRVLSDGRLLVNDEGTRTLVLFDSSLQHMRVVMDTLHGAANRYPMRATPGGPNGVAKLFAYRGDSTLILDPVDSTLIVIGPEGTVGRSVAMPTVAMAGNATPWSSQVDAAGRIVYANWVFPTIIGGRMVGATFAPSESVFVLRADLVSGRVDSLTIVRIPRVFRAQGPVVNPLPIADGWAVLSDGTVAVVRASDFHVDWYAADGRETSSPKLAHEWRTLTDDDKQTVVDVAVQHFRTHPMTSLASDGTSATVVPRFPDPSLLPDAAVPFRVVLPDADGNLWIEEAPDGVHRAFSDESIEPLWDVVNRHGEIVDRVRTPWNMTVLGFGHDVVYLKTMQNTNGVWTSLLVKARIR